MNTSYQVETVDVAISDALITIAEKCGWQHTLEPGAPRPWLIINGSLGDGWFDWNVTSFSSHKTVSIPEFIRLLKAKPSPPPILIGDYEVDFRSNGVVLPSSFVDTATVDAIHARLHADDEDSV